jgi:hypothetical protein
VEMEVALVFGVNGYGYVAEHGLWACGCNRQVLPFARRRRVANLPELAERLFVDDFEVADGGLAAGAPVDDVGSAIDEALVVEADEGFADGDGEVFVHGEVFAGPVDGGAEALHLVEDGLAVLSSRHCQTRASKASRPRAVRLVPSAASCARPSSAWRCRRGRCREPRGWVALHAVPAGEDVHLRLVEHVAHVQAAGDVGGRQQDGEGLAARAGAFGWFLSDCAGGFGEEVFFDPVFGPFIFNGGWVVGFGQVVGHGVKLWRIWAGVRELH